MRNLPKILIESNLVFLSLDLSKFANKIEIDQKSILGEGDEQFASPLSEYDALILDFPDISVYISESRKEQLIKFLRNGKPIIYILRKYYLSNKKFNNYDLLRLILEADISISTSDIGTSFQLTPFGNKSVFKDYLDCSNKEYKVSISASEESIISLADNSEENSIAFISKKYNNMYFLPWLSESLNLFEDTIINLTSFNIGEQVEDWVQDYSFKNLIKANQKIDEIEKKIDTLEAEKQIKIYKKENYEKIRDTLLYRDGKILEDVVKKVFIDLGIETQLGKEAREDLVFVVKEKHYLVEVKGAEKSASKKHIKQLVSHIAEYKNENEVEPKGILLINPWRKLPIEERNTNDKPNFPNEIMTLVNISNITLITTQQLFVAYCDNLEGKFNLDEFIQKIDSTNGVLEGYEDIERFKTINSIS